MKQKIEALARIFHKLARIFHSSGKDSHERSFSNGLATAYELAAEELENLLREVQDDI